MRLLGTASCFIVAFAAAFSGSGCSPSEEPPPPDPVAAQRVQVLKDMRHGLGTILAVFGRCGTKGHPSRECAEAALADLAAFEEGGTFVSPRADVDDLLRRTFNKSLVDMCLQADFARHVYHPYFAIGAYLAGAADHRMRNAGADFVWDLEHHQTAAFYYTSGGLGNFIGAEGGVYGAFAGARNSKLDVVDAWSGTFFSYSGSVSFPGKAIGLGTSLFTGAQQWNGREVPDPRFMGVTGSLSVGLNPAAVFGLTVSVAQSGYAVWADGNAYLGAYATTPMHVEKQRSLFWEFDGYYGCGLRRVCSGISTGMHLIGTTSVANGPAWLAAMLAVLQGAMQDRGITFEKMCPEYAQNEQPSGACEGNIGTASLGLSPRTCAGSGDEAPSEFGLEPTTPAPTSDPTPDPTPDPTSTPSPTADCSIDPDASCADGDICSKNTRDGAYCCRRPSTSSRVCSSDSDCDANDDEVCAQVNDGQFDGDLFACRRPNEGCIAKP